MLRTRPEGPRFLQLGAGRGNVVAAGAADPTSSLPFPARAGKAATRGVGRGRRGCARLYPRPLSLATLDSSPDVVELNLKGAAREGRNIFLGGYSADFRAEAGSMWERRRSMRRSTMREKRMVNATDQR